MLENLQNYWWFLISVLGGILVFMLMVQGGQSMLLEVRTKRQHDLIIECMGRKWELTFTSLVVFGGAFFASFPLFYSTSFGGAYWLWILILFSFILQAVSYEFRSHSRNFLGTNTYDIFLYLNGLIGCVLLGVAVSMFFFGADFTITKGNLLNIGAPTISQWKPTHGLEAIFCWHNLILGVTIFFLARTLAALYMLNNIRDDDDFYTLMRKKIVFNSGVFLIFFLWFMASLLLVPGYEYSISETGTTTWQLIQHKYFNNYLTLWWAGIVLVIGVLSVLYGICSSVLSKKASTVRKAIWFAGLGTFLVVCSLFWVAGYNNTAFYPSLSDPNSSLTIRNSSSSEFTLVTMSWVSLIIPVVLSYIVYVWRSMDRSKLAPKDIENTLH